MSEIAAHENVRIPVTEIEFRNGGRTLWVHGPQGATVLRIQLPLGCSFQATTGCENACSHADLTIKDLSEGPNVPFCLADDAKVG